MKSTESSPAPEEHDEISALIATLHETEQRLEELTGGEVDTVANASGRPILLRRAQEQLRHNDASRQNAILNALPAHIAMLDTQGVIVSVNEAWREFGRTNLHVAPGHGVGLNYLEVCDRAHGPHSAEAHQVAAGIRAVLEGAEPAFTLEYPCHAPGEQRWFLLMVTPVDANRPHGAVVMHVNISKRRQAEEDLDKLSRQSIQRERILTTTLSSMSDFAYVFDRAGRFTYANAPLLKLLGLTLEQLMGRAFIDLGYPAEVATRLQAEVQKVFATRKSLMGETPYTNHLGKAGYHEYIFSPAITADGTVDFVVGSTRDITERKRTETALRESNEMFHQLADNITDAFWIRSPDMSSVQYVSPAFEKIWGRTVASLQANPQEWSSFIVAEDRQRVVAAYAALSPAQPQLDIEYRIVRQDGEIRWVRVRGSQVRNEDDRLIRHIGIVSDITESKQVHEHLLQAQKMEALGQFSGGVAHDFNNILAAISGYTELARMLLPENPAVCGHLDSVLKASNRAADLVRQILTFSRQQQQARTLLPLQPIVVESMKLMQATIPSTVEIEALISADAPTVLANANQVHQVLMNLAINGWHALKDQPGRLQVKLEKVDVDAAYAALKPGLRAGTYARLSVSDTGCGMDPATLRRIFEPFFTTKPLGVGTGLGLSVVHGIMQNHDGAVTVHSQPGEGTVFRLYFPELVGDTAPGTAEDGPTPRGQGERVLLVDDEEMLAEMGVTILNRLGYAAESTTRSDQALERVRTDPSRYDLVLTDQTMPGMTGLQLASQLREIQPGLHIMLMTGYNLSLTADRLDASGIGNILHKPFTMHTLGSAVHATLTNTIYHDQGSNPPY